MAQRDPLTEQEIEAALADLDGWRFEDDKLQVEYEFEDFRSAIGFIVELAFEAEEHNHHPELENVYNQVRIALTTHDAGDKVTQKDVDLAHAIEALA